MGDKNNGPTPYPTTNSDKVRVAVTDPTPNTEENSVMAGETIEDPM